MSETPEQFDEVARLACATVEGRITRQQRERLEQLLNGQADAQRFYRDYIDMHISLEFVLATPASDRVERTRSMPAMATARRPNSLVLQEAQQGSESQRQRRFQMSSWRIAAVLTFVAAAVMAMTSPTWLSWWQNKPIAIVADAVNAQWVTPEGSLDVGDHVPYGALQLTSGYAHIRLDNGVDLIVQGPAHFSLDSLRLAHLVQGKITADVPHAAMGFSVKMPAAMVTDLGTTFGVTAFANGEATVQVLKGSVQAKLLAEDGTQKQTTTLQEDHAAAFNPATGTLAGIPPAADAYVTNIHQIHRALAVHNTGADLKPGDADPNWLIVANSDDPTWTAKPGVVTDHRDNWYPPGETCDSQWLSTAQNWPNFSAHNQLTYSTTIDLTGLEPATAQLQLAIRTDNDLVDLRLNGKSMGIAFTCRTDDAVQTFHQFTLDHGFVAGRNTLEFVVANEPILRDPAEKLPNPMGLRVELSGGAMQSETGLTEGQ